MHYAWKITKDHTSDDAANNAVGVCGPSDAPDELLSLLDEPDHGGTHTFTIYDDDGELYLTGVGTWEGAWLGDAPDEDAAYGPLGDYGRPAMGATEIRWQGHPEWDCN